MPSVKSIEKMMPSLGGKWQLPSPPKTYHKEWVKIVRPTKHLPPFGYTKDPNDSNILIPIPKQLEALEMAKKLLSTYSYDNVAEWVSQTSGKKIRGSSLRRRLSIESKDAKEYHQYRFFQERAEEAGRKAKEIEDNFLGKYEGSSVPES